jgi:flagellar biosynthesis protein FlhA
MLGRQEVMQLLENVKKHSAELVDELIPSQFTYGNLQKILNNLLKEGVPIKDMETILETIVDSIPVTRDIDVITENIRIALKRTITRMFCDGGQMKVLTLDADLEKNIISSMAKGEQGVYLALSPDVMQSVIGQMGEHIKKFSDLNQKPVVLTSQVVRLYFYRLIEQFYPNVYVLSFNEIANNIQIQAVGNITV